MLSDKIGMKFSINVDALRGTSYLPLLVNTITYLVFGDEVRLHTRTNSFMHKIAFA